MRENMSISNKDRIQWVDVSRGIAIILVVFGHVIGNAQAAATISGTVWKIIHDIVYSFHMPLFFFISGCVNHKKGISDYKKCLKVYGLRFVSLLIPYIVFCTLYLGLKVLTERSGAVLHPITFSKLRNIWIEPIGLYWFLYCLIIFTILDCLINVTIVDLGGGYSETTYRTILIAMLIISAVYCSLKNSIEVELPTGVWRATESYFFYIAGLLVREYGFHSRLRNTTVIILGLLLSCLLWILRLYSQGPWSWFLLAISEITVFVCATNYVSCKTIENIGKDTMPVYLLHIFFIVGGRVLLTKVGIENHEAIYVIVLTIISTLFPIAVYRYIVSRVNVLDFVFKPQKYLVDLINK